MSDLQLERIQIKNLFNRFTYDITVKNGYDVAILIAPNGCGKTTIFNLIDFIFKPTLVKYQKMLSIPFDRCICSLSNGKTVGLEIRKIKPHNDKKRNEMAHRIAYETGTGIGPGHLEVQGKSIFLVVEDAKHHELNLEEVFRDAMSFVDEDDISFTDVLTERYVEYIGMDEMTLREFPPRFRRTIMQSAEALSKIKEFIEEHNCSLDVSFIAADRLHQQAYSARELRNNPRFRYYDEQRLDPLQAIQEQMQELYSKTDAEYTKLVSEARDKLPKMFLNKRNKAKMTFKAFVDSWEEYVSDMEKYYQLGLLESSQTILENSELEKSFKENGDFLTVYLEAFKSTLKPWNREYERLKLFADILNKRNRVTGKELKYGPSGLIISVDGHDLPLSCLSSGEKNDLVMFFNLIFKTKKGGLVLIDEPEISLHIEWQEEYLDWLLSICEMNGLKAIVATHSPNIVNGHFELHADRGLIDERNGNK